MKIQVAAVAAFAVVLAAGCGAAKAPAPAAGSAGASAHASRAAPAVQGATIPVLHKSASVTFGDPQAVGSDGATVTEMQTWKLTSVHYISYAAAMKGGQYGDVPANLGSNALKPGDRYLVLGLTITDHGPDGMSNTSYTVSSASYGWAEPDGHTGLTQDYCLGQAPPGNTQLDPQFVSSMCVVNALEPGQSVTGYLFFEVPVAPAVVAAVEPEPQTPLLVIDPDGLVSKDTCVVKAKFC